MNERLSRLHEMELRMTRALGRRPNISESELAEMPSEMRDEFMSFPPSSPAKRGIRRDRKQPTDVYRLYDASGTLLYVGLSMSVAERAGQHRQNSWWHLVARIEIEKLPDRDAASDRERELIATLRPLHNRNGGGA